MNGGTLQQITQIIERDSKDTTYKFALLRGVIDIIQSRSPYIRVQADQVQMPLGLLVERWLLYYYPIIEADRFVPQKNGEKDRKGVRLAFRPALQRLTGFYRDRGGFSVFYSDLVHRGVPREIEADFLNLCKLLSDTITRMPMKHLGYSVFREHYSVFRFYKRRGRPGAPAGGVDLGFLVHAFGTFTIPTEFYEVFRFMGSFLSGTDNLLFQWAAFTVNASNQRLSTEEALRYLLTSPVHEREVEDARRLYTRLVAQRQGLTCVWSGRSIRKFDVDHLIPFSVWRNNNLWNLLPAAPALNNRKRDKIPAPALLRRQRAPILHYWALLGAAYPQRFQKEVHLSLLGDRPAEGWQPAAFEQLVAHCGYLIETRGFEAWEG